MSRSEVVSEGPSEEDMIAALQKDLSSLYSGVTKPSTPEDLEKFHQLLHGFDRVTIAPSEGKQLAYPLFKPIYPAPVCPKPWRKLSTSEVSSEETMTGGDESSSLFEVESGPKHEAPRSVSEVVSESDSVSDTATIIQDDRFDSGMIPPRAAAVPVVS